MATPTISFSASLGDAFRRHNAALRYVVAAVCAVTALILFIPAAQKLLKFGEIAWLDMALALGSGLLLLLLLERRHGHRGPGAQRHP